MKISKEKDYQVDLKSYLIHAFMIFGYVLNLKNRKDSLNEIRCQDGE